jgi:hypothetical protein
MSGAKSEDTLAGTSRQQQYETIMISNKMQEKISSNASFPASTRDYN